MISFQQNHHLGNIWRRTVLQNPTYKVPSNILQINALFQRYFQKYHRSIRHASTRSLPSLFWILEKNHGCFFCLLSSAEIRKIRQQHIEVEDEIQKYKEEKMRKMTENYEEKKKVSWYLREKNREWKQNAFQCLFRATFGQSTRMQRFLEAQNILSLTWNFVYLIIRRRKGWVDTWEKRTESGNKKALTHTFPVQSSWWWFWGE